MAMIALPSILQPRLILGGISRQLQNSGLDKVARQSLQSISFSKSSGLAVAIVFYVLLYEWGLFETEGLVPLVYLAKLALPFCLFLMVPVNSWKSKEFMLFMFFFTAFWAWSLVPSLFSDSREETVVQWLKHVPRLAFAFLVGLCIFKNAAVFYKSQKLIVVVGCLTVLQYVVFQFALAIGEVSEHLLTTVRGGVPYAGPYGLFGSVAAVIHFGEIGFPIYRLTGFWVEPSLASGFLLAAFFLSRVVTLRECKRCWNFMGYTCLLGGVLCLSNGGYFGLGCAMLWGALLVPKTVKSMPYLILVVLLALGLGVLGLAGRTLVAERYYDLAWLRVLAGVRGTAEQFQEDPSSGRIELLKENMEVWAENPLGIGVRIPGQGGFEIAHSTAPVLWMTYTGFLGIILLILREQTVMTASFKGRRSSVVRYTSQAWMVMLGQQLSYGTWMTPMYLLLCVSVLAAAYHGQAALRDIPMQRAQ